MSQVRDEDRAKATEIMRNYAGETEMSSLIADIARALSAARAEGRRECALTHGVSKEQ